MYVVYSNANSLSLYATLPSENFRNCAESHLMLEKVSNSILVKINLTLNNVMNMLSWQNGVFINLQEVLVLILEQFFRTKDFQPYHTSAYRTSLCQRMKIVMHTLTYARGTLGISCIRFKHGGIRWHTARQKSILSMFKNVVRIRTTTGVLLAYGQLIPNISRILRKCIIIRDSYAEYAVIRYSYAIHMLLRRSIR
ncbi:hypothetical protein GQR58_020604 [Nymphon striatum]|nr:hypothetical protein GQR58_020604 [Nymphon striatum]